MTSFAEDEDEVDPDPGAAEEPAHSFESDDATDDSCSGELKRDDDDDDDDDDAIDRHEHGILSCVSSCSTDYDEDDDHDDDDDRVFGGSFPSDIHEKYELLDDVLGEGSFGTVRKCRNKVTSDLRALKTIDKSKLPDATQLKREVDILSNVDHPHIIKLYDVYEDEHNIYLVSELCSGGELYDRVVEKTRKGKCFTEYGAARIIRNILSAISYCHDEKHIVHRDLKPENFLLTDKTDNAQVKVIDFGLSRYSAARMQSQVGTIYYVAPEVLFGEYTSKADIWSIGVVAYVLLCGFPPFNAGTEGLTYNIVKEGNVAFPSPAWDPISTEAKRFVRKLMDKDPEGRPSAAKAMEDPWVNRELVKNPFRRRWHGTFLSPTSEEFRSVPDDRRKIVAHADRQRRDTFHRDYYRKQLLKKAPPKQQKRKKKKKKRGGWLSSRLGGGKKKDDDDGGGSNDDDDDDDEKGGKR